MDSIKDYDWRDQQRRGMLHAYLVTPTNLEDAYGELSGINWAASSISSGYYTDTRTSGKLTLIGQGDEYIAPSFIRIVYEIPDWGYLREIGTYAVKAAPASRRDGQWQTSLELHSMLYTMSLDLAAKPLILAANSWAIPAMESVLDHAGRDRVFSDANDKQMGNTKVMESGQSQLARMFALCEMSDNRMDVNGHGVITIAPYKSPNSKTPIFTIDLGDPRGIAFDDLTRSSNLFELPSESTVIYRWTESLGGVSEQKEISATAYTSGNNLNDFTARGYNVSAVHSVNEMNPATFTQANNLAKRYLVDDSYENVEYSLTTKYLPIWEGDVVELIIPDSNKYGGAHKCLVKSTEFVGPYMDVRLTLKELTGGD